MKLSASGMIAIDAAYHLNCLTKLYRDAANIASADYDGDNLNKFLKAQAFAELVDYIESPTRITAMFKMSYIVHLYYSQFVSFGADGYVHTTRPRHQVREHVIKSTCDENVIS